MQLSWQRSHSAANRPPKVKAAAPPQNNGTTAGRSGRLDTEVSPSNETPKPRASGPREFTFIAGRSAKRRKRHHASDAIAECSDSLSNELPISPGSSTWSQSSMSNRSISKLVTSSPFPRPDPTTEPETYRHRKALRTRLWQPIQEIVCEPDVDSPSDESLEQGLELQHYKYAPTIPSPSMSGSTNDSWAGCPSPELAYYASLSFIPQLCFATLHDKFSGLLDMYDQEFCKYPITNDFGVNPYRYRPETTRGSRHLLHALLAVATHFTLRSPMQLLPPLEALDHKNESVALYQGALSNLESSSKGLNLLDTTLVQWQLEATVSALNIWRSHLADVHDLLDTCGGVEGWSRSRKTNIQVGMVLWWDAMVALLARQACVLPYTHLEAVLRDEGQSWTFYQLNGCPRELFVPMIQLANLSARSHGKTASRLVSEIEQSVRRYQYPGQGLQSESDDEETMHAERDRFHCCEGFRHALLIYILRVFTHSTSREQQKTQSRISFLSRVCLDHVAACRSTSIIQKQLLFPVFIAGSETRNIGHREFAEEYCKRWFRKFGYQMYLTVLDVMETVWTEQDIGHKDYWWGAELDKRRAKEGEFVQFCFG